LYVQRAWERLLTRALDTNIIVRFLTRDDPVQTALADAAIRLDFLVTATVLLEVDWVLASYYGWSREQRVRGLNEVLDLPHAVAFHPSARWALDRTAKGADFADMMHLAVAEGASLFLTFDKKLKRLAGADVPLPVELLS
jgi:predicted nucleic-acid-binding protein